MKLTKIHRVLQFNESPWLAKYINFNTEKRKEAEYAFEKDFFKLMNNAGFFWKNTRQFEKENKSQTHKQLRYIYKTCIKSQFYIR